MSNPSLFGFIKEVKYRPCCCRKLKMIDISNLKQAIKDKKMPASFLLNIGGQQFAVSYWVSAKRTRSYPFARVYDTYYFSGKKVTIIPVYKDEGKGEKKKGCKGDRDFIQWDTVSLMSLLNVYVILAYYIGAEKVKGCHNRITNQVFDADYIEAKMNELLYYQASALHWNTEQLTKIGSLASFALQNYDDIGKRLGVQMHSRDGLVKKIKMIEGSLKDFLELSRVSASEAQRREILTIQPKEKLGGKKGSITIHNFLGGYYFFTCDEVEIGDNQIRLIEGKHNKNGIPKDADIKEALVKMILYCNLKTVEYKGKDYAAVPALKLTSKTKIDVSEVSPELIKEAKHNGFEIMLNNKTLKLK